MPETAQLKMNSLIQANGESLEDWADIVFQLALRAYKGLPEEHMLKQAIKRICHGCMDKEAGHYAVNQHPDTIECKKSGDQECVLYESQKRGKR